MYRLCFLIAILIGGCNSRAPETKVEEKVDTMVVEKEISTTPTEVTGYGNARFKNVTVDKTGDHTFLITGKGQVFEATISWVVEDGHDEL